jgi:hypothetical protein
MSGRNWEVPMMVIFGPVKREEPSTQLPALVGLNEELQM